MTKCQWCDLEVSMRYVDYGRGGADVLMICKNTRWKDGFPIPNSCGEQQSLNEYTR